MDVANHCLLWAQAHHNTSTHMLLCIHRCCTYHWCVTCPNIFLANPFWVHIQAQSYAQGEVCLVLTNLSDLSLSLSLFAMYTLRLQISSFLSLKLSSFRNETVSRYVSWGIPWKLTMHQDFQQSIFQYWHVTHSKKST